MPIITRDLIESLKTERGGWTRVTLDWLGVTWPPKRGWKARIIGKRTKTDLPRKAVSRSTAGQN